MKRLLIFPFLFFFHPSMGQNCNCGDALRSTEQVIENDLPAYRDQVIAAHRTAAYNEHKKQCDDEAAMIADSKECTYLIAKYISFFRDEHLRIDFKNGYFPFRSLEDTAAARSFFQKERVYDLSATSVGSEDKDLCGYWRSKDGNYVVKIVPHKTELADHMALIVQGDPLFWSRGQLKFTLKKTGVNSFSSLYLVGSRQPRYYEAVLKGTTLTIGRMNIFYRVKDTAPGVRQKPFSLSDQFEFRELSSKTNYLHIPSFDLNTARSVDTLVANHLRQLTSKPYLVIDVRFNGGGGDRSYQALLPFIMAHKQTINPINASILATPGILKHYEDTRYDNCENRDDSVSSDSTIALMQRFLGRFTPTSPDTVIIDTVYGSVRKVAVIMNRWCSSATEGFIVDAMQNNKVVLCGENTHGCLTYGDWQRIDVPCLPISLTVPTKKEFFSKLKDCEGIGIPPALKLKEENEETWVEDVRKYLEH